jgi:hypothetical protein
MKINVRLSPDTHELLTQAARVDEKSVGALAADLITDALDGYMATPRFHAAVEDHLLKLNRLRAALTPSTPHEPAMPATFVAGE